MVIKESTVNPEKYFNFNGLDYQKDLFLITYGNITLDENKEIIKNNVTVGLRHKINFNVVLTSTKPVTYWSNGSQNFTDLDSLVLHMGDLISFNTGGGVGVGVTQNVGTFSELIDGVSFGEFAYVQNTQGTKWLPNTLGGTYYGSGLYMWNSIEWVEDDTNIFEALQQFIDDLSGKADVGHSHIHEDIVNETFEQYLHYIKSLDSNPVFGYTAELLTSITYTWGTNQTILTLNYNAEELVISLVLSGVLESGINTTKTLSYVGDNLTNITYA